MRETEQQQEILDDIVDEFTRRLRAGERPAIREFSDKYPEHADEIQELLTSVAMIEELKKQPDSQADSIKNEMRAICKLDHIGDYRIVRELGRGGMGIVFEAVHESLGRRVAIKVMPNRTFDDEKYLERFKREAHAAANLHHTNIVSVFGMGQAGDHRYYVMEFVDGMSLSDILTQINQRSSGNTQQVQNTETLADDHEKGRGNATEIGIQERRQLPPIRTSFNKARDRFRWAAKLGMQIADGLAYAHGMGMLHRDIKPANLLVDRFETVWLTDFGLVKNISNQSITKSGDIIGTPQYMAPEAFEGIYDERSETYCLGLTLYEMVTLQPAYENASTPELIRKITTTAPVAPRKIDGRIPRDLNRIIQKSISREPAYRYESASELRNDLLAFLEDRPISARKISMTENLYRWSRRNPLAASLTLLTSLMIFCVAVTSTIYLDISKRRIAELQVEQTRSNVERRIAAHESSRANKNLELLSDWLDYMFMDLVLKDVPKKNGISLDGFDQLRGISTTVNETDAEFLSRMLEFYEWFVGTTKEAAVSAQHNKEAGEITTAIAQGNAGKILPDVQARSHRRIGNIYHLSGEIEEAVKAYDKAIAIYEDRLTNESKSLPLRINLARVLNEKGQAIELEGDRARQRAVKEYRKAARYLQDRIGVNDAAIQTNGKEIQLELAKTLALIGAPHFRRSPALPDRFYPEGYKRQFLSERRKSGRSNSDPMARMFHWFPPGEFRRERERKRAQSLGKNEEIMSDTQSALMQALEIVNKILEQLPPISLQSKNVGEGKNDGVVELESGDSESTTGDELGESYNAAREFYVDTLLLKATILTRLESHRLTEESWRKHRGPGAGSSNSRFARKPSHLDEAIEIVSMLRDSDPKNPQFQFAEALIRSTPIRMNQNRSISELTQGDVPESMRELRQARIQFEISELKKARKLLERLTKNYRFNHEYQKLLAEVSYRLGVIYVRKKDVRNAEKNLRTAFENSSQLTLEAPRSFSIQQADFLILHHLTNLLIEKKEFSEAEEIVKKSIENFEQLRTGRKRMPMMFHHLLAGRYRALAMVYKEKGDLDSAKAAFKQAREMVINLRKPRSRPIVDVLRHEYRSTNSPD